MSSALRLGRRTGQARRRSLETSWSLTRDELQLLRLPLDTYYMIVLLILLLALLLGGVGLFIGALKWLLIIAVILFLVGVFGGYGSFFRRRY